jgi:hypothetical protein
MPVLLVELQHALFWGKSLVSYCDDCDGIAPLVRTEGRSPSGGSCQCGPQAAARPIHMRTERLGSRLKSWIDKC